MSRPSEKSANGAPGAGPSLRSGAIRIAGCYLGFAILWLVISIGVSAWVRDSQSAVLIATVEFALKHEDLAPEFREYLQSLKLK